MRAAQAWQLWWNSSIRITSDSDDERPGAGSAGGVAGEGPTGTSTAVSS
jgi:hypothetical protein